MVTGQGPPRLPCRRAVRFLLRGQQVQSCRGERRVRLLHVHLDQVVVGVGEVPGVAQLPWIQTSPFSGVRVPRLAEPLVAGNL